MSELARLDSTDLEPFAYRTPTVTDTDSWIQVLAEVSKLAGMVAGTEFVPKSLRDNAPAVAAAILYGREVGLAPMTSLTQTHVIEGRPAISAEGMRALILAAGHELAFEEATGERCTIKGRRRGTQAFTALTWSMDMARAAGLANRPVWRAYPRSMLIARASTDLARMLFPDVIHGFRAVEELEDTGTGPAPEADVVTTSRVSRRKDHAPSSPRAVASAPRPAEDSPDSSPGASLPPLPGEPGYPGGAVDAHLAAQEESQTPPELPGDGPGPEAPPSDPGTPPEPPPSDLMMSDKQRGALFARLYELGVDPDEDERKRIAAAIVGRPIESFTQLSMADASHILDTLAPFATSADVWQLLDQFATEGETATEQETLPFE